jgi:hypothetical protein
MIDIESDSSPTQDAPVEDARFEDGVDKPVRIIAQDTEGLTILSALLQDAIFVSGDIRFARKRRRFAVLVNRFRWEDRAVAEAEKRGYERVRSLLVFEDVMAVRSQGLAPAQASVLSVLGITFEPGTDGTGTVVLSMAGVATIALNVETLDATLTDVTRPYLALSGKAPLHDA